MSRFIAFLNRASFAYFLMTVLPLTGGQVIAQSTETFGSGANQFSISLVAVGNPNNAGVAIGGLSSVGSVPYPFRIGRFEISRQQISKANLLGGLGLTLDSMSFVDGTLGVGPRNEMPATGLTWNEVARFVNWLNISQGYQPAYRFAVQPGQSNYNPNSNLLLWDVQDSFVDARGVNRFRHKDCRYFLPSIDEWYKAAYYDPSDDAYRNYPTGENPPASVPQGISSGTAVFQRDNAEGPADVSAAGGLSWYGAMGLAGNAWEFEETAFDLSAGYNNSPSAHRGGRGGAWNSNLGSLAGISRLNSSTNQKSNRLGFRIASVAGAVAPQAQVVASYVYHAESNFAARGVEFALDTEKNLAQEGLTSQTLGFENVINTSRGINGLVFDIQDLANPGAIQVDDFEFQISPQGAFSIESHPPKSWMPAPSPSGISATSGPVSRLEIRWPSGSITNCWLRITIRATASTGLVESQTYYLGHLQGETTGLDDRSFYRVQFSDIAAVRKMIGQVVGVGDVADIDKSGIVQFSDLSLVRVQVGRSLSNISIP